MQSSTISSFLREVLLGAPAVVSSNWVAFILSGFLLAIGFVWEFCTPKGSWRERIARLWPAKRGAALKGVAFFLLYWATLFSISAHHVLGERLKQLDEARQQAAALQQANKHLMEEKAAWRGHEQPESAMSLRRRTTRLVNDLARFWGKRPTPLQPVTNPSTDAERQRNANWDQHWREVRLAYDEAHFRERILRIVREYKQKGIDTGFLEQQAEFPDRQIGSDWLSANSLENCVKNRTDLCTLSELAYHVDLHDQPILLNGPR